MTVKVTCDICGKEIEKTQFYLIEISTFNDDYFDFCHLCRDDIYNHVKNKINSNN